ncbi:hypothetical protein Tco_1561431 [Tanacetum coccineum]
MVSSNEASLGDQEDASKQGRKYDDIGQDMAEKEINVAEKEVSTVDPVTTTSETLMEIRSVKPKVKGVVIGEQSESTTRTRPQQLLSKDKDVDYQMAQQMQVKEQEKLSIEEKSKSFVQLLEARKKHFAAMRAKEKTSKPPTKAQKRTMKRVNIFEDMDTKLVEDSAVRAEGSSKRAGEDLQQESTKKQKMDDVKEITEVDEDKETAELQSLMKVIPDEEEVAVDAIPLSTKPPSIVDWKILK